MIEIIIFSQNGIFQRWAISRDEWSLWSIVFTCKIFSAFLGNLQYYTLKIVNIE